jgi:hypothetical protein
MAESYGVVSSGTKEEGEHDRKCDQNRNFLQGQGSTGKTKLRMDGPQRSDDDGGVIHLRNRWQVPTMA